MTGALTKRVDFSSRHRPAGTARDRRFPRTRLLLAFFCVAAPLLLGQTAPAARDSGSAEDPKPAKTEASKTTGHEKQPWSWHGKWIDRKNTKASLVYTRKHGLEISSRGGNYKIAIRGRLQLRYSDPFDIDPRKDADFAIQNRGLRVRRARLKTKGHVFRPWVTFKYEHDLVNHHVLDLRTTIKKYEWLQFRAGQWKVDYNRDRDTSSAKQQFADRSIVNRTFTVDRQAGFEMLGHLLPNSRGDSRYFVGVYTGNGRGAGFGQGGHPMYVARYQWNFLGRDLPWSSSDLERHEKPVASIAVAGLTNRSPYTRFSGAGGSQLDGFEPGAPGQYSLKQAMGEFALKYRGFSAQSEYHLKQIFDHVNDTLTKMHGFYAQAGYLPHGAVDWIPRQLEIGYRYGFVDWRDHRPHDHQQENTIAVNWFFEGHNDKLVFEVGRLSLQQPAGPDLHTTRYRVQWDIHF